MSRLTQLALLVCLTIFCPASAAAQLGPGWVKVYSDSTSDHFVTREGLKRFKPLAGPEYVRVYSAYRLMRNITDERLERMAKRARLKLPVIGYEKWLGTQEHWEVRCKDRLISLGGVRDIDADNKTLDDDQFERKWLAIPASQEAAALRAIVAWACTNAPPS
jgi:hypothetical protein